MRRIVSEELNPNEVEIVELARECGFTGTPSKLFNTIESAGDDQGRACYHEVYDYLNIYTNRGHEGYVGDGIPEMTKLLKRIKLIK